MTAAVGRVGPRVGVNSDTLRGWVKQADIDAGVRPGITTTEAARIKELEREVRELKRANDPAGGLEFLRAGAGPATAVVIGFIDDHRDRFGVEPICRVLREHGVPIAPSRLLRGQDPRTVRAGGPRPARDGVQAQVADVTVDPFAEIVERAARQPVRRKNMALTCDDTEPPGGSNPCRTAKQWRNGRVSTIRMVGC